MKSYLDCIPCFFDQALRAARVATNDERKQKQLMDKLGRALESISLENTPPETGRLIYRMVAEVTGVDDPYRELKHRSTNQALALYPALKKRIEASDDSLLTAIRVAIAGNVMDFGANAGYDIDEALEDTLRREFAVCDYAAFKNSLENCNNVLYIGDNAGETVFDRLLIEQMNKPTTYVVRERPIINDAVAEDAVMAGLDKVATIVSSGTDAPGTILRLCREGFIEMLDRAEFIIAKGQGNYEGLSEAGYRMFFLLKAKCRILARDMGVGEGDIILREINL